MLENVINETFDIIIDYMNQKENQEKIKIHVINPIITEVSSRLGKYIFILFFAYIVVLILIIYILCTLLSKEKST